MASTAALSLSSHTYNTFTAGASNAQLQQNMGWPELCLELQPKLTIQAAVVETVESAPVLNPHTLEEYGQTDEF